MGIETHKDFDQIVKSKLQQYEVMPPDDIWLGIQKEGIVVGTAKTSNWKWWAAVSALTLFMVVSSYFYYNSEGDSPDSSQTKQSEVSTKTNLTPQNNAPRVVVESDATKNTNITLTEAAEKQVVEEVEKKDFIEDGNQKVNKPSASGFGKIRDDETVVSESSKKKRLESKYSVNDERASVPNYEQPQYGAKAIPDQQKEPTMLNAKSDLVPTQAGRDFFDQDAIDEATNGHLYDKYWVFGIEFSPEWITIPENNNNIKSYGIDLSARYQFSKFFLQTGLGIAFSKDNGDYDVDYQEALFKGSYEDVYNVTFEIVDGNEIPTYYTKTVNVYDTVDRVSISENKNSYAYLNVPLYFGYYTQLNDRFSFYAKLGLNAGFKIYENIPTPTVTGENVTIIKLTPRYFNRTSWHLQSQISLGLNYHITKKFLFSVEPNARYYIKSLVENNHGGNPYGFGVKLGFKYVFK